MSERGVFGLDRSVLDHEIFPDIAYSEKEAWIWLIAEAAWKKRTRRVGEYTANLERGQLLASVRFLAEKWKWSKSKVERFLNKLKTETMIETQTETGITIITICNYAKYQRVALPDETDANEKPGQSRDRCETVAGQSRDNTETLKHSNIETLAGASAPRVASPAGTVTEPDVYRLGRDVLGKNCGGIITNLRKHCRQDLREVWDLLEQARDKGNSMEWVQGVLRGTESAKVPMHQLFPEEVYRNVL